MVENIIIKADDDSLLCPICNNKMKFNVFGKQTFEYYCYSKCFHYSYDYGEIETKVFDKLFYLSDEYKPVFPIGVVEEINYWKENQRYITKLLE